jgi:hypothetical protein
MTGTVIDTNVLTIASAPHAKWVHPRIPLADLEAVNKVFEWVKAFRDDATRHLVMDYEQSILDEYRSVKNMPEFMHYGRQVVHHKVTTGAMVLVALDYQFNGTERVARLPAEVEALMHDLGDRKMVAAAAAAGAPIVNASDADWTNESEKKALELMEVDLVQLLTDEERALLKGR